jgi:peptide/nickel transport system ATP-binding protein
MYAGKAVEYGKVDDVFYRPEHPYTWGLLSSVTRLDRLRQDRLKPIAGSPPSLINVPSGCAFHPRCPYIDQEPGADVKKTEYPPLLESEPGHLVACHMAPELRKKLFAETVKPTL